MTRDEVLTFLHKQAGTCVEHEPLIGREAVIDSMALVELMLSCEDFMAANRVEVGTDFWTRQPIGKTFATVGALADYLWSGYD